MLAGWLVTGLVGVVMLSQMFGWNGTTLVATLQALTPYAIVAVAATAAAACWASADRLAVTSSLVGIGGLILAAPVALPSSPAAAVAGATGTSVASVNLLYSNPDVEQAAGELVEVGADIIVFSEYTAEHQDVLLRHELAAEFPYKIDRDGLLAGGIAIWSRYPIVERPRPPTINYTLDIDVEGPDGSFRIFGVHPPTPIFWFEGWTTDLAIIADLADGSLAPTLVIGDFNASYWHPAFRDILRRGFVDAHISRGQGLSTSWPMDRTLPPFVRLDHALTGKGLTTTALDDFTLTGSDHRGFVVSVAPTR